MCHLRTGPVQMCGTFPSPLESLLSVTYDIHDICDALVSFCDRKLGQLHQIDRNIAGLSESQE